MDIVVEVSFREPFAALPALTMHTGDDERHARIDDHSHVVKLIYLRHFTNGAI